MTISEMTTTAREYREIQAFIRELTEQADALKQKMIAEMDSRRVDKLSAGEYTISYIVYESNRLDSPKLKTEHADLYNAYCKSSTATRFQVS